MKKKAIAVIDMQKDFVTGVLGSKEAGETLPRIEALLHSNALSEDPAEVFFTMDTHGPDYRQTQEGRKLPIPHCLRGSDGWKLCGPLERYAALAPVFEKNTFGSVKLAQALAEFEEVLLTGVCTDICVISNAMLIRAFSPETRIRVRSGLCAGSTPERHRTALLAMAACQVEIED